MAVTKITYASPASFTITIDAGLDTAQVRESTAVDNSTNLYDDAMVYVALKTHASTAPTGDKACSVYAYGSSDGTNFNDFITGSDAETVLVSPTNLRLIGVVSMPTANTVYKQVIGSVALAFGGVLPPKWGIAILNSTGATLNATGHAASYTGITYTTA
jgi:hypothetical protein